MTIEEAITILKTHNEWRRGAEIPMTDPKIIGEAIDTVVNDFANARKIAEKSEKPTNLIWHKVTDGDLPKVDKYQKCIKVFVRKGNDAFVAFFSPIAGFSLSSSFYTEYMLNDIDYWMEIPELPKGD